MHIKSQPSNGQNIVSRLFFRFVLCYALALPIGLLLSLRQALTVTPEQAGLFHFLFIPLGLFGALLTITKPYLLLLTVFKAFYDVGLLYHVTLLTRRGSIGILPWNACFFLTVFTVALFCFSASRAEVFAFYHTKRNLKLIFSRPFGRYLLESIILIAIALSIYFLWPQLCDVLELCSLSQSHLKG